MYDGVIGGYAFNNETRLNFSQRSMTIFIQTDKPIYKQSEIGMVYLNVKIFLYFTKLKFFFFSLFSSNSSQYRT